MELLAILLGSGIVGLAGWCWGAARRRNVDEMFAELTPGMTPLPGTAVERVKVPGGSYTGEIAVAFNPPKGVRPGLMETVVHGAPRTRETLATIVDLAARGFMTITIVESTATRTGRDWQLRPADVAPNGPIEPGEQALLDGLFADASSAEAAHPREVPPVVLSELPAAGNHVIAEHGGVLLGEADEAGLLRQPPGAVPPFIWPGAASVAVAVGGFTTDAGELLFASGVGGLATLALGVLPTRRRRIRTAEGTALYIQALAFKQYLLTAEAEQFSFEEAVGIFSRYLPHAMVLGVADHWARVFGDLAARAHAEGHAGFGVPWLHAHGPDGHDAVVDLDTFTQDVTGDGWIGDAFDPQVLDTQSTDLGESDLGGGGFGDFGGGGGGDGGGGGGE